MYYYIFIYVCYYCGVITCRRIDTGDEQGTGRSAVRQTCTSPAGNWLVGPASAICGTGRRVRTICGPYIQHCWLPTSASQGRIPANRTPHSVSDETFDRWFTDRVKTEFCSSFVIAVDLNVLNNVNVTSKWHLILLKFVNDVNNKVGMSFFIV